MKRCMYFILAFSCLASMSFGAIHVITAPGFAFSPDNVSVTVGDTVQFSVALMHNAVEVSLATWNADDTTSNGGFRIPFGGGSMVMTTLGTYYYVCQNHVGLFGMKGIITVTPVNPASNSITIECIIDGDGSLATTADRALKNWNLTLYKDSVSPGTVVASVAAGPSLTVDSLFAGTYIAVEADSSPWSHLSTTVDGSSQGLTSVNRWTLTVGANESRTVDFLNFAPHAIVSVDFVFSPDSLVVVTGDTVRFVLDPMHKPREVSESTWLANDTVSNGGFDLPYGGGNTVFTTIGTHYYVCVPHASIAMKGKIVVLSGFSMVTGAGWNMISIPIAVSDSSPSALFPTAGSKAFRYQGTYVDQPALRNGSGYWLKFPSPGSTPLAGTPISAETVDVAKGWNMIGTITAPVPVFSVGQLGASVVSSYFGYSTTSGYFSEDTLKPGLGYWVKMNQAGRLALQSGPFIQPAAFSYSSGGNGTGEASAVHDLHYLRARMSGDITFSDRSGGTRHLYIADGSVTDDDPAIQLPPPGPEGIMDVRFAGDRMAERFDGHELKEATIRILSAAFPLTVSWNMKEQVNGLRLVFGSRAVNMQNSGTTQITNPESRLTLTNGGAAGGNLPATFALLQNYPNPFNPTTVIRYQLPVDSRVRLKVFNLLGQEVRTLIDQPEQAGYKSVEWNAVDLESGLYFYRLESTPVADPGKTFMQARKMLLIK